ncbi:dnaJ homolog subfamily B member 14-like [Phoenix dactylifera]|uniref:DnaJ homolog subfamily B member 14-like n=1 Tax=Phoenix dactylifera TaxID=42345 RepID=A0A8B7D600_PHODC|nr:dnaJ homolog subfamily B member 14-like [Phoenix dactylifera]
MQSNQEEAERAMAMAEDLFKANDVEGAMKFALKAKTLFPSLPGLPQAIAAYEVHIAGEKRKRGDTHWRYAVLGVTPSDTFQAIKRRYKKLCIQIHPDKNRSAAADGAFILVKEAWDMISEGYAEAQSCGANTHAGPKVARQGTRNTRNTSSSHGGANAHGGPNSSSTYGSPTDANGGPNTTPNSSHAFGGGNNASGSSRGHAAQGYWYWEFYNAYGPNSYRNYHQCNFYGAYFIRQRVVLVPSTPWHVPNHASHEHRARGGTKNHEFGWACRC